MGNVVIEHLMPDKPKPVSFLIPANALSASTATMTFGVGFWTSPSPPVEAPAPDNPIYAYVGRVAAGWAHVEHTLDLIIWELADINPAMGACITAQINSVYSRCKVIIAQLKLLDEKDAALINSLIKTTTDLMNKSSGPGDKRNRIVHDAWYRYTGDTNQAGQFRSMPHKDYTFGIVQVDQEALEEALTVIKQFSERTDKLLIDIRAMLAEFRG